MAMPQHIFKTGSMLFCLLTIIWANSPAWAQIAVSQTTFISADNLKAFIVNNDNGLHIQAPPGKEQTEKELIELKEKMRQGNDHLLQQIRYWNAGSPAYRWNLLGSDLLSLQDFDRFARTPTAWMNIAIYDATVVAWKIKKKYQRKRPAQADPSVRTIVSAPLTPSYPCEHSVAAAAAATVLAYFYPEKADSLLKLARQAAESRIYAGVQYPSDVDAGWKLGEQVANHIIEEAKKDGSDKPWTGSMHNDPKLWRGEYPVGIMVGTYEPLVLKSRDQFRPPPPPDFAKDMQELKDFKQNFQAANLAYYWASHTGFDIWTNLAHQKIFENRLDDDALACARIYALLHVALHDAAIVIMDAKYAYWGIRPFQYDPAYKPLIFTPPFPGYPSGHATAASTAATVLEYLFPNDAAVFRKTARECAESRFYAGIHFRTDNEVGLEMGRKLGQYVVEAWDKK